MGVMNCNKKGCDEIMCRTYISSVGYICYECKTDFKDYLENKGKTNLTEYEINEELKIFMDLEKGINNSEIIDIDDFFNNHTS